MPKALIPVSGFPLSHELFRVAGGGPGWQVAGSFASMFSQPPTANRQYLIQVGVRGSRAHG